MPRLNAPDFLSPIDGGEFDIRAPRTGWVVALAGLAIVIMAAAGFYRGLVSATPALAGGGLASTSAIVSAKPAAPVVQNPNWSVLSGPTVIAPPTAKAQASDQDDSSDSDGPDDQDDDAPAKAAQAPAVSAEAPAPIATPSKTAAPPAAAPEPPPY